MEVQDEEEVGNISKYAVAIGSAWRTAVPKEKYLYDVDLLPQTFRESLKQFKLGLLGWLLLFSLPAIAFFATVKIIEQQQVLTELIVKETVNQQELTYLQGIEAKLNEKRALLSNYQKAFGVVDEMSVNIERWNKFLIKLSKNQDKIGRIWVTEINPGANNDVTLRGFSVYKDRIPLFSNAMSNGDLSSVLVQKIRERTVYAFEFQAPLPND
jgi:hypothetical protein